MRRWPYNTFYLSHSLHPLSPNHPMSPNVTQCHPILSTPLGMFRCPKDPLHPTLIVPRPQGLVRIRTYLLRLMRPMPILLPIEQCSAARRSVLHRVPSPVPPTPAICLSAPVFQREKKKKIIIIRSCLHPTRTSRVRRIPPTQTVPVTFGTCPATFPHSSRNGATCRQPKLPRH